MPTRRIMLLSAMVAVLVHPAAKTVKTWGRRQLAVREPGTVMHGIGEVLVSIL